MGASFIGRGITVEGDIACEQDLIVAGAVKGAVESREAVLIETDGVVDADVRARRIELSGRAKGSLAATDRVELKDHCQAACRISGRQVVIEDGSSFTGEVDTRGA